MSEEIQLALAKQESESRRFYFEANAFNLQVRPTLPGHKDSRHVSNWEKHLCLHILAPYSLNQLTGQNDSTVFQKNYRCSFSQLACDGVEGDDQIFNVLET